MNQAVKTPRKLIEVALPLDAINEEASKRKRKAPAGEKPCVPCAINVEWRGTSFSP